MARWSGSPRRSGRSSKALGTKIAWPMSRFAEPQHAVFRGLNDSLAFDWRLGPYDVEQSRAHASMLAASGIISEEDREALLAALEQVQTELRDGTFPFSDDDEDIHMAIERRITEIAG